MCELACYYLNINNINMSHLFCYCQDGL